VSFTVSFITISKYFQVSLQSLLAVTSVAVLVESNTIENELMSKSA